MSTIFLSSAGLSAVRPEMSASVLPLTSYSSSDAANCVPYVAFISSAHSPNALPGGESAPGPRKYGSTMHVSWADGQSPSSICLPWYQPMPRFGTPQPTRMTSHLPSAPPRRRSTPSRPPDGCAVTRLLESRDCCTIGAWLERERACTSASILDLPRGGVCCTITDSRCHLRHVRGGIITKRRVCGQRTVAVCRSASARQPYPDHHAPVNHAPAGHHDPCWPPRGEGCEPMAASALPPS